MRYIMESPTEGQRIERKTDRALTCEQLCWAGVRAGQRALDLGCAAGTTCRILGQMVGPTGAVVGVDGSEARIAEARQYPGQQAWIEYRTGTAEAIPAPDGEFDVTWSRFLFEYLRDPAAVLREMVRVTRRGGTVAVSDLDGNCVWHEPVGAALSAEIGEALGVLRPIGFDPHVGRRLYRLAWEAGLTEIEVDVRPYHVIAGQIGAEAEALWEQKIRTTCETLRQLGWCSERAERLHRAFLDHLRGPGTFTYSVLISVKGRRP
jgi:SAM-dependent methyltransferase